MNIFKFAIPKVNSIGSHRRGEILFKYDSYGGSYRPNHFIITIGASNKVLEEGQPGLDQLNRSQLSLFVHEYWHYLQNISTPAGVEEITIYQVLLSLLWRTLEIGETVKSSKEFSASDIEEYEKCIDLLNILQGDRYPAGVTRDQNRQINSFKIIDVVEEQSGYKFLKQSRSALKLSLEYESKSLDKTQTTTFNFGKHALFEGLAYEIDRSVEKGASIDGVGGEDNAFLFPYHVMRELALFKFDNISRIEILALGTLALLYPSPGVHYWKLLQSYQTIRKSGFDISSSLEKLISISLEENENYFKTLMMELEDISKIHQRRGVTQYAWEYLISTFRKLLSRRKDNPLFDLEPFAKNMAEDEKLHRLMMEYQPCIVLQENFSVTNDDIQKDYLFSFSNLKVAGFSLSDMMGTLQCLHHFMESHRGSKIFMKTDDIKRTCPMYSCCNLPTRKNNPKICKHTPWKAYQRNPSDTCWYGSALASLVGAVEVSKK